MQTSPPALGIQCPALVLQPPPLDWEGMDGRSISIFIYALVPIPEPGSQGQGTPPPPPQLPASDVTTPLPTWAPLGLKGASQTQATSVGLLACSPAPAVAELISHLSILRAEAEDGGGCPTEGWRGAFHPPPETRQKHLAPLFPVHACGWKQQSQLFQCVCGAPSKPPTPTLQGQLQLGSTSSQDAGSSVPRTFPSDPRGR